MALCGYSGSSFISEGHYGQHKLISAKGNLLVVCGSDAVKTEDVSPSQFSYEDCSAFTTVNNEPQHTVLLYTIVSIVYARR